MLAQDENKAKFIKTVSAGVIKIAENRSFFCSRSRGLKNRFQLITKLAIILSRYLLISVLGFQAIKYLMYHKRFSS